MEVKYKLLIKAERILILAQQHTMMKLGCVSSPVEARNPNKYLLKKKGMVLGFALP